MSRPDNNTNHQQAVEAINSTTTVLEADLPSPRKEMTGTIDAVNITVNYGSPAVKGRDLWGSLVPYDKVWRTGANEATRFTIDQDIAIGDQVLPAGTYGLFTVPSAGEWQLIFNSTADQWGAYEYDSNKDVLRVNAQPKMTNTSAENLDFMIQGNKLLMVWGKLKLPVSIGAA